jgi:hypothetical protein
MQALDWGSSPECGRTGRRGPASATRSWARIALFLYLSEKYEDTLFRESKRLLFHIDEG